MPESNKNNEKKQKQFHGIVDESMISHENDPYFIRKRDEAIAFLRKAGLPKEVPGSDTFFEELERVWGPDPSKKQ